jgi:hypothetical protein
MLLIFLSVIRIADRPARLPSCRIGHHVGRRIAAVKLHAFHGGQLGLHGLASSTVITPSLPTTSMALEISSPTSSSLAEMEATCAMASCSVMGLGQLLQGFHGHLGGFLDAALQNHGVGAGGQVLQAFAHDGLRQQRGGGGAVAGHVVGLGGDFFDQLGAHVLKGVFQLNFLGDGHAVVGDEPGRRTSCPAPRCGPWGPG